MINNLSYKVIKQPNTISEQTFYPNKAFTDFIKVNKSNILVIKASNSSGKTYILEMLAFAFFGLELNKNDITESLQRRLKYLVDETHQTFEFEISIIDPDGSIIDIKYNKESKIPIIKKTSNKTVTVLTKEMFLDEYKLLFDVPENPLDRIFQVTKSIKDYNSNLLHQLNPLDLKIGRILHSIRDERNEKLITELKDRIEIKQQSLNSYSEKKNNANNILQDIENAKNLVALKKNIIDKEDNLKKLNEATNNFNRLKKPDLVKNDVKSNLKINEIKIKIKELNLKYSIKSLEDKIKDNEFSSDIIKSLPEYDSNSFNILYKSSENINSYIENNEVDEVAKLLRILNHIKDNSLNNYFNNLRVDFNGENYYLIQNLIKDFQKYELEENSIFEEIFNKQVSNILFDLKEKEKKDSKILRVNELEKELNKIISDIIFKLNNSKKLSVDLFKELGKNSSLPLEDRKYNSSKNELSSLTESKSRLQSNFQKIRNELESNEISLNKLDSIESIDEILRPLNLKIRQFSGNEIIEIDKLKSEIKQFEHLATQMKNEIIEDKIKLKIENDKMSSSFSMHKDKLTLFSSKLTHFIKYLHQNNSLINDDGELNGKEVELNMAYIKLIGEFVASTMGNKIIYQNESLEIEYVDYSTKTPCFVTVQGKRIAFPDFSGGQASSNYLKSKLNINDNKKYIVLFDEIANMDNRSLNEVIDKLKILNENKKLLLAILAEPHKEEKEFIINGY